MPLDEQVAEDGYGRNSSRREDCNQDSDDKTDCNLLDECDS